MRERGDAVATAEGGAIMSPGELRQLNQKVLSTRSTDLERLDQVCKWIRDRYGPGALPPARRDPLQGRLQGALTVAGRSQGFRREAMRRYREEEP